VLPGVTVEAASPVLIEKVRTAVTDADGQYRIIDLRGGVYTVTFTLGGFNTVKRAGVVLAGSFTAKVDAEMRVGALEETITVSGESPIVDVQNTKRQRVMDREIIDDIPTSRTAYELASLIPGVSRSGGTIVAAMAMRVDRAAAAEFTFFLAMPTMAAAFAHDLLEARHDLGSARGAEIAVGFVMAFIASALVVKPFLHYVRRSGFAPFAWYRIALGLVLLAAVAAGWL
jgi:undecaprenyl pyrophosphate phosphatase UppP